VLDENEIAVEHSRRWLTENRSSWKALNLQVRFQLETIVFWIRMHF